MPSNNFIRFATLLALFSVTFAVRRTDRVSLERYTNDQEAKFNPQLQEDLFDPTEGRYISLLQEKATAGTRSQQSGEQLTSAQSSQHTSGTVGDEIGNFSLQSTNDSTTDPLQQLQATKSNLMNQQSTTSPQSAQEQSMIDSLSASQQSKTTPDSGDNSTSSSDSTTESTPASTNSSTGESETTAANENTESQGTQADKQEQGETSQPDSESKVVASEQPEASQVNSSNNNSTTASSDEESQTTVIEEDPDPQNLLFGDSDIQDEDEPQAKNREYLTVAFMIGVFALILLIILIRRLTEKTLNDILLARLNSIMKDTIIIITILTVTLYMEFMDVFDWHLNVNGICLAFLAFALSWLTLSTVLVLIGQSYVKGWESLEASVSQKDMILVEYRELYKKKANKQKMTNTEKGKASKYRRIIEYVLVRQEFIAPTFLPVISEAFLRDDFNFALYLSHALGGVLGFVFNLSTTSLATAVANICIWAAITDHLTYVWNTVVAFSVIGVLVIILLVIAAKFRNIHGHLIASVDSSINLPGIFANFISFKRDPLACAETRSDIPGFLSFDKSSKPYRRIFQDQQLANRQERLFWLGAPNFSIKMVHCIVITHMIWTMIFAADYWANFGIVARILLGVAAAFLFLLNAFFLTPRLIRKYTIINHIQMKRDFNLIEKVVLHQRKKIRSTLAKFYRLLKSSRKEIVKDSNPVPKLKPFLEKQITDAFKVLNSNSDSKVINLQDLKRLVHLCGKEIKRDELVYLAREATNEDYQRIHLDDLIRAVEHLSQDVKLEPFATSREVLKTLAENETHISLKELGKIIADHKVLSKEEINSIIHELKYLSWDGQEVEIDHVAAYIRNNLECMPR